MNYVIEVGINRGTDTRKLLDQYPNSKYIGFEPVVEMYNGARAYMQNKNVAMIYPAAVSDYNGTSIFNETVTDPKIAARYGSSSLYEFKDDLKEKWNRADFKTGKQYEVQVYRLDKIIEMHDIDQIDYLHCDAQGSDLNVLKGLGNKAHIVKAGVVEATRNVALYKGSDNTEENVKAWLNENGFKVVNVTTNDKLGAEVNIHFERV